MCIKNRKSRIYMAMKHSEGDVYSGFYFSIVIIALGFGQLLFSHSEWLLYTHTHNDGISLSFMQFGYYYHYFFYIYIRK